MHNADQYVTILFKNSFFHDWETQDLVALLNACTERVYNAGEPLWTEGETSDGAFILLEGRVERTRTLRPNGQKVEQYAEPGTFLSLSSLPQPVAHSSSANALERTTVLAISQRSFEELFEAQSPAAYRLVDAIASNLVKQMREANTRLHQVFGQPAETLRMLRRRMREEHAPGPVDQDA